MGLAETAELAIRISLTGNARAGVRGLKGDLGGLNQSIGRVGKGVGQIGSGFARAGLVVGGAVATGLTAAAKAGADFEAQLNTINTIARATPQDLTAIGDGIRTLAREGRGDLADLSAGFYDILSAGITDAADAQKVLKSATTLAIGGLSTNAQAVDLLTTAINAYGQDASAAQADADLFAKAIEIGKVKADEIAASFANVAPIAAQVGINIEEVAAAYGALTAQGTPAAEVTTQMSRAILDLLSPNKELLSLQKKTGQNFLQIAQDKGLVVALQAMRDGVKGNATDFKDLFGRVEGYKFALQTTGPQQKIYNDALAAMGDSAGTATEQMGERQKGLAYAVGRLKANLVDAALTLSSGFLPALSRTADKLSTFLGDAGNRGELKALGQSIGDTIDKIDWDKVLDGAKSFASVMKGALDFALLLVNAIDKLPGEIKAAGLGFLALNKLSGGLLGAGVGNVVGGLAGAAATGLASRAPGVGRLFAQPVFVTNWPIGGLGGGPGGLPVGGAGGGLLSALAAGAAPMLAAALLPILIVELTKAALGGTEGIRDKDLAGRTATNLARGGSGAVPDSHLEGGRGGTHVSNQPQRVALSGRQEAILASQAQSMDALEANRLELVTKAQATTNAVRDAKIAQVAATRTGDSAIVRAIYANRPYVNVNVTATSTTTRVTYTTGTTLSRYAGKLVPLG